jgi:hypothetical protein
MIYKATELEDGLVKGKTYRFKSRTRNDIGYSEFSIFAYIAFGNVPEMPGSANRVFSTESQISVEWTEPI